jgi:hypothetical protein
LGDLSPKNIGIRADGRSVFFDLESFHYGNKLYDVAVLAAHIYLHYYESNLAKNMVSAFIGGYQLESGVNILDNPVFGQIFSASIIYRLDVPVIQYPVKLFPSSVSDLLSASIYDLRKRDMPSIF